MAEPETSQSLGTVLRKMTFDVFATGQHKISRDEFFSIRDAVLLGVRSNEEVCVLSLAPAVNLTVLHIPLHEIPDRVDEIPADRPVAVFCSAGIRATMVYVYLRTLGFSKVRIMSGGLPEWIRQAFPSAIWKRHRAAGKES